MRAVLFKNLAFFAVSSDAAGCFRQIASSRCLILSVSVVTGFIMLRTTLFPMRHLGFFGDDFAFLNWTAGLDASKWLGGFLEPGNFNNLTYRPLAAVTYLVYMTGSPAIGYSLLAALFVGNTVALFFLHRRVAGAKIASLSVIVFAAAFIYFDATHKIYNLITQASCLLFLSSLHCFLRAQEDPGKGRNQLTAAYLLYALSLLTYEITVFGFLVIFALAISQAVPVPARRPSFYSILQAARSCWVFGALSAMFVIANLLSPIKAAHLRDHAIPLTLSSVPVIASRGWEVLKNTCAWIIAPLGLDHLREIAALDLVLLLPLVGVLWILLGSNMQLGHGDRGTAGIEALFRLFALGALWFVVFLVPGAISTYFDYRMTFLAYAGLSLAAAAALKLAVAASFGGSVAARWAISGCLATAAGIWLTSNVAMADKMNRGLIKATDEQRQILDGLKPYVAVLPEDSVIAIRYDHRPSRTLPYPYMSSPFAEDYALRDAVEYHLRKKVNAASLFFQPQPVRFEVGRFAFARSKHPYAQLALFDMVGGGLTLRQTIKVSGEDVALPLAAGQAGQSHGQPKLAVQ